MNIFVLDVDPILAATMQCDKHVVKMCVETAQILSTVMHRLSEPDPPYRPTHVNHPCVKWACEPSNRLWTTLHLGGLLREYSRRYDRVHACERTLGQFERCVSSVITLPVNGDFVQCMPEAYRVAGDDVAAYRAFYVGEKSRFARWKHGNQPSWYGDG